MVTATTADRGAGRAPVRRLTVLYDAGCPLCAFLRGWLMKQRQLVPLDLVPAGSAGARRRFPRLDHAATFEEITVVADAGQVYRGPAAWVVCLWALREYRPMAHRFSTPAGARFARGAVIAASRYRESHRDRRVAGAGGGAYLREDGWRYDPRGGWAYTGPATCGSGCSVAD
ncbi:thiol-disulfide oxidoreductase DCC family protein [Streptomyces sp. NPDC059994]|uniref:thiol-disulfide oxidoreductase DCC family protein n=1 Tax=Streptomyces sp. NPDC059994 TaxID=3347029 RepID=UPI0036A3BCAB